MKNKIKLITSASAKQWVSHANIFAHSLCPQQVALKQFNALTSQQRNGIVKAFSEFDEIRRRKIPKEDATDDAYITCVMVDSHIVATEYGIDPLTAIMCLKAPCKSNELVIVK